MLANYQPQRLKRAVGVDVFGKNQDKNPLRNNFFILLLKKMQGIILVIR